LQFPGPWLSSEGVLEFRVHWAGKPYHVTTPSVYKDTIAEIVDSGVNLFSKEFSAPNYLSVVIKRAFAAGVSQMVAISVDLKTSEHSVSLAKKYAGSVFAVVGVHPVRVVDVPPTPENEKALRDYVKAERKWIHGIGECGIDYEKVKEETLATAKEFQEKWLTIHLDIATEHKLPIFIHQRGGFDLCLKILKEHLKKCPDLEIVVNCFSGTVEELKEFMTLKEKGVYIVITGLIGSDDRGSHLRDVVKNIPLDRLLIASDAPHLTPYNMTRPYPRRNEPAFLPHTLVFVSECLGQSFLHVAKATTENARRAFKMPVTLYDGTVPPGAREIVFSEFQKDEDVKFKVGGAGAEKKKAPPKKLVLGKEQTAFILTGEDGKKFAYIVSTKEHAIMTKQEKGGKTVKELTELAVVMELQKVAENTVVMKEEGSEEVVFSNADA